MRFGALLLSVALLASVGDPREACADEAADARGRAHNESAKRLFAIGMWKEAAEEYKRAYRESPKPAFLFNLGQCYKRMPGKENLELARFYYRGFLRAAPDSPHRAHVEAEVEKLDRRLAELKLPARDRGEPPGPAPASTPVYKKWWFWTIIGAAVTGAAVGTGLALGMERRVDTDPSLTLQLRRGAR